MANMIGGSSLMSNLGAAQNVVNQNLSPVWQGMVNPILDAYGKNQGFKVKSLNDQLGMAGVQYGVDTNYQNTLTGYDRSRLGLNEKQLGIQQGALGRAQNEYLPQQQELANQGFNLQGRQMDFGADQQTRGLTSDATARGALVTGGTRRGYADINQQLAFGKEGLDINQRGSDLSFKQQRDQLKDEQKNLDIAAESLGIDKGELETRANYALNQLGLSATLTSNDIMQAINDASSGIDNPIYSLLPQIYQLTGLRPTASAPSGTSSGPPPVNSGGVQAVGRNRRF